jgi:FtsP/CotA-like multicopper oxidase with cupredoxin domain
MARALTRRQVIAGLGLAGASLAAPALQHRAAFAGSPLDVPVQPSRADIAQTHRLDFLAKERSVKLLGADGPTSALWTFSDDLQPIIRARPGDRIIARLTNSLLEHTSIHWHGVRVPNAMDGVQFLTQPPVEPGTSFTYDFILPDSGTFFFHPHCNESGQVGRGMAGLLIVEGDAPTPFDAEINLAAKDWRLAPDGSWLPFETLAGAGKAGTFGTIRHVNSALPKTHKVPAHGLVRLRLLNLDSTRVMDIGFDEGEAALIATDGNALPPVSFDALEGQLWRIGPAQRIDVALAGPAPGKTVNLIDYRSSEPFVLARFEGVDAGKATRPFQPFALYRNQRSEPDLNNSIPIRFDFSAASSSIASLVERFEDGDPLAKVMLDDLCVRDKTLWAINKISWPNAGHKAMPPPLMRLEAGKTYRATLTNATPHPHPIHLHGMTFRVLSSNERALPVHDADTVLLAPKERIEIAFVATRGDWMIHCHILEHLEYGMMGYVRVA